MVDLVNSNLFEDDLFVDDNSEQETLNEHEHLNNDNNKNNKQKSKRKRNRKKAPNKQQNNTTANSSTVASLAKQINHQEHQGENREKENEEKIEIELVPEEIDLDRNYAEFASVFEHFKLGFGTKDQKEEVSDKEEPKSLAASTKEAEIQRLKAILEDEDEEDEEEDEKLKKDLEKPKLSKRKQKLANRLSVAALKQLVNRPDVVEMHDVTAQDPKLLVNLKATRNTVPVPRHWCAKRQYLQGKRGFEKPPFELPDFIKRTGIQTMREAVQEKEENKSLKQKMREKVRPKMGRIDIDYQKLHDAFFKWQTKPRLTIHGDLYYEGKELERRLKEKKPGTMSEELRVALGMPIGPNSEKVPPPWLIAMQRYGPPPSYPSLKIPGLNAPIPDGCSFGYHAGGWGKPPVDEFGRPLYGDVFGSSINALRKPGEEDEVDRTLWGEMEEEFYEEIEPEEEEDEEDEEAEGGQASRPAEPSEEEEEQATGTMTEEHGIVGLKAAHEGLTTPSGISTGLNTIGLETPDMIELRKRKNQIESEMEGGDEDEQQRVLYRILPEKNMSVGASMMGSSKLYDIASAKKVSAYDSGLMSTGIDLALNPDELGEMGSETLHARYDQAKKSQRAGGDGAEPTDMMDSEDAFKQKQKKKKTEHANSGTTSEKDKSKKYKEFKF